ncbi:type VII secretion target [Saccharopolyspora sp. NPDC002686]|uniref:type VII secretion target n=1 Tax=Saccharopolyspora sp. NPDC002686 TaxID=3154541 RepID=UPI0033298951
MSGLGANTGELASAATSIKGCSQAIGELKNGVSASKLGKNDFGREHTGAADPYFEGLKKISKALEKNASVTDGFADNLNSAARGYEWDDSNNAAEVGKAGGDQ